MRPIDGVVECLHPVPWLLSSWGFAAFAMWLPALVCSFMFFLTALRLNHEAIHNNLGFGARGHRRVLHGLSLLMLGSNHAVAYNHLRHHKHVGRAEDIEGKCGRMGFGRVLAYGPFFPVEMHLDALRRCGRPLKRRIMIDLVLNLAMIGTALVSGWAALRYHVLAMVCAQCLTAFFAVWITHRGCHGDDLVARTQRSRLVSFLAYSMFFHLEHHLFPGVPVRRLSRLAARIDLAAPEIAAKAGRVV